MHRRGLSDVVTTVLIILLVVVAVVAIGAYVTTLVGSSGRTVEREGACLVNTIKVDGCRWFMVSAYTAANEKNRTVVSIASSTDASVRAVSQLSYFFTYADGTSETFTSVNSLPSVGKASVSQDFANMSKQPTSVAVGGSYTLADGKQITCAIGTSVSCLKEATNQLSYLTSNAQALQVQQSIGGAPQGGGTSGAGSTGSSGNSGTTGGTTTPPATLSRVKCSPGAPVRQVTQSGGSCTSPPPCDATEISTGCLSQPIYNGQQVVGYTTINRCAPFTYSACAATPVCASGTGTPVSGSSEVCAPVSPAPQLPTGLLAHWRFEGDLKDQVNAAYDLSVANGADPILYDALGVKGQAYKGTAQGVYATLTSANPFAYPTTPAPNSPLTTTAYQRSISVWFKLRSDPIDQGGGILRQRAGTNGYIPALYVSTDGTKQLRGSLFYHGQPITLASPPILDFNWHHAVIAYQNGVETLYVDGVLVGTQTVSQTSWSSTPYAYDIGYAKMLGWPGAGTSSIQGFIGSIDEFRVYDHALTQAEVLALNNTGS